MAKPEKAVVVTVERGGIVLAQYPVETWKLPAPLRAAVLEWQRCGCIGRFYDYLPAGRLAPAK